MSDAGEWHRKVADAFTGRVRDTTDWDAPAPVDGWRARDVVGHLTSWFPAFLASGTGIELTPGAGDDPAADWTAQTAAVQKLLDDPATAGVVLRNPHIGEMPLPDAITNIYVSDVFMHTWDLARAGGLDDRLDPEFCAQLLGGMEQMDEVLRSSGQYGPRVPVPDDASPQDRLIGFIGRDPQWARPGGSRTS
ncbi:MULTISPECIES: TIGR03086 family metal-binding protein [unclassified Pseudonocardia]|jgi:uncharacterized protein (TIGR03086 family)|uniref:TIGR03086 family metal-binding protein n=1 Tax=unclassified Pseudonocardia TaxID=2619320 RepID=UPI00095D3C1A|nr:MULTISPECIES: TIGR03086 family metal-binding protein [unclassified Pseudonocardia]MBN9101742.1 TIGR03086 family protein [Pseudonocardia sp.]OJY49975.1 MAG: TIGR03086 family protein [Pseudonocardia sp. 73-21]